MKIFQLLFVSATLFAFLLGVSESTEPPSNEIFSSSSSQQQQQQEQLENDPSLRFINDVDEVLQREYKIIQDYASMLGEDSSAIDETSHDYMKTFHTYTEYGKDTENAYKEALKRYRFSVVFETKSPYFAFLLLEWSMDFCYLFAMIKLVGLCGFEIRRSVWVQTISAVLVLSAVICFITSTPLTSSSGSEFLHHRVGRFLLWANEHFQLFRHVGIRIWYDFIWMTFKLLSFRILIEGSLLLVQETHNCLRRTEGESQQEQSHHYSDDYNDCCSKCRQRQDCEFVCSAV